MADGSRQAGAPIQVTAQMVEAGVQVLRGVEFGWDSESQIVEEVFFAMIEACPARLNLLSECPA